jgi:hypothetical protein
MKQIFCKRPHATRKTRDFSFTRFFTKDANPALSWHIDKETKRIVFDYIPKHFTPPGRIAWDSWKQGTRRRTTDKNGDVMYVSENNSRKGK